MSIEESVRDRDVTLVFQELLREIEDARPNGTTCHGRDQIRLLITWEIEDHPSETFAQYHKRNPAAYENSILTLRKGRALVQVYCPN